jgi:hypothetical protein
MDARAESGHFQGNYYERIDSTLNWLEARDAAAAMSFGGRPGHLVTILSEEENNFVDSVRSGGNCWIGANDIDEEGDWRWVTGELFWTGGLGGSVVDGFFEAWNNSEPNNSGNEDGAHMFAGGSNGWNDLPVTITRDCYLVEFSGPTTPVPTLGQISLGGLILLIGLLGWRAVRPT